jgi:predicted dienelactone hydrolase
MINRILFVLAVTLLFFQSTTAQTYAVGKSTPTMVDAARSNRNIPIEIYYPADAAGTNVPVASGVFPVMVIGHGFSMGVDAYYNFRDFFVPKGYIIVLVNTETGLSPVHATFGEDLNYCVNYMQAENTNNASIFFGKVKNKTALMGHSMGGGCSFLAAATGNPNITTLLGFAPAETSTSAITAASSISVPALMFYGSKDVVTPPADHVIPMYNNLQSSCKAMATITDGAHCRFGNTNATCNFGEGVSCIACSFLTNAQQHQKTFAIMEPWINFFLKEQCNQWTAFESSLDNTAGTTYVRACNYTLPTATATAQGATQFCDGGSVGITGGGLGYNGYLWSNGETTTDITATQSGNYTLEVTDQYNCKDTSNVINVTVGNPAKPALFVPGDNIFCDGESVAVIISNYDSTQTYLWSTGETSDNIIVAQTLDVFVKVTDSIGCEKYSDTLSFTMNTNPPVPTIQQSNDTLFVIGATGIVQWSVDGNVILNSNVTEFVPTTSGVYSVAVIDANGCFAQSADFTYIISSVTESENSGWNIYPNPVSNSLKIQSADVSVYDITGRKQLIRISSEKNMLQLNLSNLAEGMYVLKIQQESNTQYFHVMKAY